MNGVKLNDYKFYAYENNSNLKSGVYIAYDNDNLESEFSRYSFTTNSRGQTVLTFYAVDGEISWIKRTSDNPTNPGGSGGSSSGYAVSTPASILNGTISVSPRNANKGATVTITVTPHSGYQLDTLAVTDKNGDTIDFTDISGGKYTFIMPASSVTVTASFQEDTQGATQTTTAPILSENFQDVDANAYYAEAVQWAVANGITTGTTATTFAPEATCTRAQFVTFLWRAMGSPAPVTGTNPFTDVNESDYYNAILWAVEQDITAGTSRNTFSPNKIVTRGETVTFLWRAAGKPTETATSSFTDVKSNAYYYSAVLWAINKDITTGTALNTFSPAASCTRAQVVTFLYRDLDN